MNTLAPSTVAASLQKKLEDRTAVVAVIGLGYVGLPLCVEFARAGYQVLGVDVDQRRVDAVNRGDSYIGDIPTAELGLLVKAGKLRAVLPGVELETADCISICVPTPLRKTRDPDISYINSATAMVKATLRRGQLVVLESTTYPGTTEEVILPRLAETGLKAGEDFFLAFSPERVDPGNPKFNTRNTPKVVGGHTPLCAQLAALLYSAAVDRVVPVNSCAAAEMVKLLENTFRSVNIGLVNEMAIMCRKLNVDVWEVIAAAATKPFGFMPFWPGPGLGGHCIPIDPHYLSWKLRALNYNARFIEMAGEINSHMPEYVLDLCAQSLNTDTKPLKGSRVLVLGVAYKRDVDDCRESPGLDIITMLQQAGSRVEYADPHVPKIDFHGLDMRAVPCDKAQLAAADLVIVVTDHTAFDIALIAEHARLIVDTRNLMKGRSVKGRLVRL
ncbi:MAG: nucleotide sugar dehydrogenase [Planctomycetes bacterium]|nr:nucleotide sugar dehydrogenase [Planctomycetota bacterium]